MNFCSKSLLLKNMHNDTCIVKSILTCLENHIVINKNSKNHTRAYYVIKLTIMFH